MRRSTSSDRTCPGLRITSKNESVASHSIPHLPRHGGHSPRVATGHSRGTESFPTHIPRDSGLDMLGSSLVISTTIRVDKVFDSGMGILTMSSSDSGEIL